MSSIQPVHVHFPALLEQPPIDRVRKVRLAQVAPWPSLMYMRLSMKKTYAKRGLVYPKLAQSKGSGDRMHSPDLFWGSRRVSAVPSRPGPRASVPPRGMIHLSKPDKLASSIRSRTRFEDLAGGPSSEHASPPLLRFVGVGGPLAGSRYPPAIEDDAGLFAPSSPPFLSRPISSYSSGTSTSGRDSENSSVAFDVGI